jgi:predicted Zn-dependent peptidase
MLKDVPLTCLEVRTSNKAEKFSLKNKKTDQAHFVLGFLCEGRGYHGRFAQSVLTTILGRGMSSRLFNEVREKRGLAYGVRAGQDRYADIGDFDVYAGVMIEKIGEAIEVVMDQVFGLASKKYPIKRSEFEKAKSFMKGRLALRLEDSDAVNDFFSEQALFDREILTPKEIYKKIDAVKVDQVYAEAKKIFKKDGVYLTVIGPYKNKDSFLKILK